MGYKQSHYHYSCGSCGTDCNNSCGNTPSGCKLSLSALCVVYEGNKLDTLGIKKGERLESILADIDEYLQQINDQIIAGFIGINVGGGVELYKGVNNDDVGEMRTFISTDTITVSNTENTISFDVNQAWLDSTINPLIEDVAELTKTVGTLDSRVTELEKQQAKNTEAIKENKDAIKTLDGRVDTLNTNIISVQDDLLDVLGDVGDLKVLKSIVENLNISEVITEQFQGQMIVELANNPKEILNVFYLGGVLPSEDWAFEAPNRVALQVKKHGISVEPTDILRIEYKK